MYMRAGEQVIYDNFRVGCVTHPEDDTSIYLVFTDVDNEEVHMFEMKIAQIEQYFNLVRQTANKQKIEVVPASAMPHG